MSETANKQLAVIDSITGPGFVDLMENFAHISGRAVKQQGHQPIFIGYQSEIVPETNELVCAVPGREAEFADLIVTAVNAHSALLEACKEFVRKCECGEARSVRSYAQMKAAIALAEGEASDT